MKELQTSHLEEKGLSVSPVSATISEEKGLSAGFGTDGENQESRKEAKAMEKLNQVPQTLEEAARQAALPETDLVFSKERGVFLLSIKRLSKNEFSKTIYCDLVGEEFENLKASIKNFMINPILVCWDGDPERPFRVVTGNQRFRAAQEVGMDKVPVTYIGITPDSEDYEILTVSENLFRRELSVVEMAKAVSILRKYGLSREEIANFLNSIAPEEKTVSKDFVRNVEVVGKLIPELQELVDKEVISPRLARRLNLHLFDEETQKEFAKLGLKLKELLSKEKEVRSLAKKQSEVSSIEAQIKKAIEEANNTIRKKDEIIRNLENQIAFLEEKLKEATENVSPDEEYIEALKQEIEELRAKWEEVQEEKETKEAEVEELKAQIESLRQEREEIERRIQELKEELAKKEQEIRNLKRTYTEKVQQEANKIAEQKIKKAIQEVLNKDFQDLQRIVGLAEVYRIFMSEIVALSSCVAEMVEKRALISSQVKGQLKKLYTQIKACHNQVEEVLLKPLEKILGNGEGPEGPGNSPGGNDTQGDNNSDSNGSGNSGGNGENGQGKSCPSSCVQASSTCLKPAETGNSQKPQKTDKGNNGRKQTKGLKVSPETLRKTEYYLEFMAFISQRKMFETLMDEAGFDWRGSRGLVKRSFLTTTDAIKAFLDSLKDKDPEKYEALKEDYKKYINLRFKIVRNWLGMIPKVVRELEKDLRKRVQEKQDRGEIGDEEAYLALEEVEALAREAGGDEDQQSPQTSSSLTKLELGEEEFLNRLDPDLVNEAMTGIEQVIDQLRYPKPELIYRKIRSVVLKWFKNRGGEVSFSDILPDPEEEVEKLPVFDGQDFREGPLAFSTTPPSGYASPDKVVEEKDFFERVRKGVDYAIETAIRFEGEKSNTVEALRRIKQYIEEGKTQQINKHNIAGNNEDFWAHIKYVLTVGLDMSGIVDDQVGTLDELLEDFEAMFGSLTDIKFPFSESPGDSSELKTAINQ